MLNVNSPNLFAHFYRKRIPPLKIWLKTSWGSFHLETFRLERFRLLVLVLSFGTLKLCIKMNFTVHPPEFSGMLWTSKVSGRLVEVDESTFALVR